MSARRTTRCGSKRTYTNDETQREISGLRYTQSPALLISITARTADVGASSHYHRPCRALPAVYYYHRPSPCATCARYVLLRRPAAPSRRARHIADAWAVGDITSAFFTRNTLTRIAELIASVSSMLRLSNRVVPTYMLFARLITGRVNIRRSNQKAYSVYTCLDKVER